MLFAPGDRLGELVRQVAHPELAVEELFVLGFTVNGDLDDRLNDVVVRGGELAGDSDPSPASSMLARALAYTTGGNQGPGAQL